MARSVMGEHSLTVVGANIPGQGPGFVILDGQVTSRFGEGSNGEILQADSCDLGSVSVSTP